MAKKRILMVLGSLQAGGAEKALVSLLNTLPEDRYDIDLLLSSPKGLFVSQVPTYVRFIEPPKGFVMINHRLSDWKFFIQQNPIQIFKKAFRTFKAKRKKNLFFEQAIWSQWKDSIPTLNGSYDIAYGGLEGICNYFVLDKVNARRKIVWVHNDYEKLGYNDEFDRPYFSRASFVATMSETARDILQRHFPESADHIVHWENIINGAMIRKMAQEPVSDDCYKHIDGINIISVGRLAPQKNYRRAIQTAAVLKRHGIPFRWTVIGDGPDRKMLEELCIELDVTDEMAFIGIRANPYKYITRSDILVVSSDYEGKSIAIDEAQVLGIPTITTDYPTAGDSIVNGQTGIICDMTAEAIAQSLIELYNDRTLYDTIRRNLQSKKDGNISEVAKYINAFESE